MNKINNDIDIRLSHVMRYINAMIPKDKKTMQNKFPLEMSEGQKDFIMGHLQYIRDKLK